MCVCAHVFFSQTQSEEKGVFVSGAGIVKPDGSTWARNPIPRVNTDNRGLANEAGCNVTKGNGGRNNPICQQFKALCPQDTGTYPMCTETQGWYVLLRVIKPQVKLNLSIKKTYKAT